MVAFDSEKELKCLKPFWGSKDRGCSSLFSPAISLFFNELSCFKDKDLLFGLGTNSSRFSVIPTL